MPLQRLTSEQCSQPSPERRLHLRFGCIFAILLPLVLLWLAPALLGQSASVTTLVITSGGAPITTVKQGMLVTLTTTVTAGGVPATPGQVNFCDAPPPHCTDIHLLATAQLTNTGTATFKFYPTAGPHTYQAVFLGTHIAAASSASAPLTVSPFYPTRTAITQNGSGLIATVTGNGGISPPTGTVTFVDTSNANYALGTVALVPGAGSSGLSFLNSAIPTPTYCGSVAVADFNGDGKPDLDLGIASRTIYGYTTNALLVLLGNGDGTFTATPDVPVVGFVTSILVADLNGDGKQDLVLKMEALPDTSPSIQVLLGNGDGTFIVGQTFTPPNAASIAVGDFNGDGIPDLAVTNETINTVSIYLGNGDGTFTLNGTETTGSGPFGITTGDFNGDGKLDLAVANAHDGTITVLLGNGDGTFTHAQASSAVGAGVSPAAIRAADLNGDGVLDLVVVSTAPPPSAGGSLTILLGKGDGTFIEAPQSPLMNEAVGAIALGDLNGDGKADLVISNQMGASITSMGVSVLLGNGDGTFLPGMNIATESGMPNSWQSDIAIADFNADGFADVVWGVETSSMAYVLLAQVSQQTATAALNSVSIVGTGPHNVDASYSGDGEYPPSTSSTIAVLAEPEPTTLTLTANPATSYYGQQIVLTAIVSPDIAQNHNATGTVTFTNGSVTLGTVTISDGAATAVATLNVTSLPIGTDSLTATYSGDTNFAISTGTASQAVSGHASTTTTTTLAIASGGNPITTVRQGTVVTLTATVRVASGALAAAPGQVEFCEVKAAPLRCTDIRLLGTVPLSSAGTATLNLFPGIPGTHIYQAVFLGTHVEVASSSIPSQLVVTPFYPTTTTITSSGSPGNYTLTATVDGGTVPTGTASFIDTTSANYVLATAPLVPEPITFGLIFSYASPPEALFTSGTMDVADFNGDDKPDILLTSDQDFYNLGEGGWVRTFLGNGDGTFAPGPFTFVPGLVNNTIAVADFNGDGKPDFVVPTTQSQGVGATVQLQVMLGNGDGTFTAGQTLPTNGGGQYIATGDFNGDGIEDLAVLNYTNGTVDIYLGNGDGTFKSAISTGTPHIDSFVVGDWNGDGILDLAVSDLSGQLTILLGNGDGTFRSASSAPPGTGSSFMVAADFNGDGILDLAGIYSTGTSSYLVLGMLLGKGDGTFAPPAQMPIPVGSTSIAYGDFNGDGFVDLAIGNGNADVSVLLGNGDGTFEPALILPTPTNPASPLAVADFNGDGLSDIAAYSSDQVDILLSELGSQTATATVNNISPVGTGTHSVDASYSGDGSHQPSTSGTIPLTAEPEPTTLTLTANPATSSYSQQVVLTAIVSPDTAQDHNATGTVTFTFGNVTLGTVTISDGAATAVATLNVTSLPIGTDSLTATYSGDSNFATSTGSLQYIIAPAAPPITFTVPNHTFGDPSFTVLATSSSAGAFTYSVVSGPATISGSTVTLTGAGTVVLQTIQAASGNYVSSTQNAAFTVAQESQTIAFATPASPVPYASGPITLSATASSGLTIAFSVHSGPATVSGSTLTITGIGTVVVAADQPGNNNYLAAPQVTHAIVVNKGLPVVTMAASPNPVFLQAPVTLTATVSSSAATPTGSVVFSDGSTVLGSGPLSSGVASITLSTLPLGANPITAAYSGDSSYNPVTSSALNEAVQDFSLTVSGSSTQTIQYGGTATYALAIASIDGPTIPSAISFAVSGVPTGSTIAFSPATLPAGSGTSNLTLTIQVPEIIATSKEPLRGARTLTALALLGLVLPFRRRLNRHGKFAGRLGCILLLLAGISASATLTGCGSIIAPRVQTFALTLTATSGALSHATAATLVVQ